MSNVRTPALVILAGVLVAASMPPWGWWPLAFVGIGLIDRLLTEKRAKRRFILIWSVSAIWWYSANLWMWDMTPPGYLISGALLSTFFGAAAALTPHTKKRYKVFPGLVALAELARWSWPFGGIPLANLALSQASSPYAALGKVAGPLLVVIAVVMIGQALSRMTSPRTFLGGVNTIIFVSFGALLATFYSPGEVIDEIDVAVVQGGGQQNTRAGDVSDLEVLNRHIEATELVKGDPDLIIWPENVVNPDNAEELAQFSRLIQDSVLAETDAQLSAGWFYPVSDTETVNYQAISDDGNIELSRYDKKIIVPFGEFVPFRSLVEQFSSEIPRRDVRRGDATAILETRFGPIGSAISWEGFFDERARSAVNDGALLLTNPTNGSSFWLTQVQTQQIAANQLHAISYARWNLQVGPTGLSAIISPKGEVLQRTDVSEQSVLEGSVELISGRSLAARLGLWPVLLYGALCLWRSWRWLDQNKRRA